MCQLFGINSKQPVAASFELSGFMRRGGDTDHHADGWGIAFIEPDNCAIYSDAQASINSPTAKRVTEQPLQARNVIAHVRKATHGGISAQNCHPFTRRLWNRDWVFAHNGKLENYFPSLHGPYFPKGETDSERAFCWLLQELRDHFGARQPEYAPLSHKIHALADRIAEHGIFNFLLSEGSDLFAYCSTDLAVLESRAEQGVVELVDADMQMDVASLKQRSEQMLLVATKPVTRNESWQALAQGEFHHYRHGQLLAA